VLPIVAAPGVRVLMAWALRRLWHRSTTTPAAVQTKVLRFIAISGYRVQRHDDRDHYLSTQRLIILCLSPAVASFTQDCAINLNPSPSGSLRTVQGVSKYIVARCSEVYAGQYGRPS
jgi:hypothetical protein